MSAYRRAAERDWPKYYPPPLVWPKASLWRRFKAWRRGLFIRLEVRQERAKATKRAPHAEWRMRHELALLKVCLDRYRLSEDEWSRLYKVMLNREEVCDMQDAKWRIEHEDKS